MRFERTKNSTRNMAFGIISRMITVLFPFITRTLILYRLGAEYVGLSGLFTSLLSVLSVSELGFGSAVVFCMYKPVAESKEEDICQLLALIRKVYKIIGAFILVAGFVLLPFLRFFIKGDCPPDINPSVLYVLYLVNTVSSYLLFAYKETILTAYQRKDLVYKIQIIAELVKYAAQIIILLIYPNYYLFTMFLLISTILNSVLIGIVSKKAYPSLAPKGKLSKAYSGILKKKVGSLAASSISSTLVNAADNIVISAGIGLTMVTIYGNYHYISSSILAFLLIIFVSLTSSIGNSLVTENQEKNYTVFQTLWFGLSWRIIWCSVCMLCLFQPFMTIWVKKSELLLEMPVVIMVVALFFSNACNQFFSTIYIHAAGLWNKTYLFRIGASLLNLILDIVLVHYFGVAGIVFASLFAYLFISLPTHIVVTYKYILHKPLIKGLLDLLFRIGLLILFAGSTYFICHLLPVSGILGFIVKFAVCVVFPNGIFFLCVRKTKEFMDIKNHLWLLIRKKK